MTRAQKIAVAIDRLAFLRRHLPSHGTHGEEMFDAFDTIEDALALPPDAPDLLSGLMEALKLWNAPFAGNAFEHNTYYHTQLVESIEAQDQRGAAAELADPPDWTLAKALAASDQPAHGQIEGTHGQDEEVKSGPSPHSPGRPAAPVADPAPTPLTDARLLWMPIERQGKHSVIPVVELEFARTLERTLAERTQELAALRLLKDMDALEASALGTYLKGGDIPNTIDAARGNLVKRALTAEADLKERSGELTAALAQASAQWIPVSERLPKDVSPVLVYQGNASRMKRVAYYSTLAGGWNWCGFYEVADKDCNPEAWIPIPAGRQT